MWQNQDLYSDHLPQSLNHYAGLPILEYVNSGMEFNMLELPMYFNFKEVESIHNINLGWFHKFRYPAERFLFQGYDSGEFKCFRILQALETRLFRCTGCTIYCTRLTACITLPLPGINLAFHITCQAFYLLLLKLIICLRTLG